MRTGLRRTIQVFVLSAFTALTALVFQNCGSYQPADPAEKVLQSLCEGEVCPSEDAEALLLSVENQEPAIVLATDPALDISGYCDGAGFADTQIHVELLGPSGTVVRPERDSFERCDNLGRWRVRFDLSGYNFNSSHVVIITMKGINASGEVFINPIPNKARKQLAILTGSSGP